MPGHGASDGDSGHSRALRAVILACGHGLVRTGGDPPERWMRPAHRIWSKSAEPFGLFASHLSGGGLLAKWQGVQRRLDDEMVQLALCEGDPDALRLASRAAISRHRRHRQGPRRPRPPRRDQPRHQPRDPADGRPRTIWRDRRVEFAAGDAEPGAGDCEDYAIAKFIALRLAGVSPDDLRIVIMRDTIRGEDHAVAAARLDGHWLTLDNRRMAMVEDAQVRNYRPSFVLDRDGVKRYEEAPMPVLGDRNLVSEAVSRFRTSKRRRCNPAARAALPIARSQVASIRQSDRFSILQCI